MGKDSFIIKWYEKNDEDRIGWFLRRLCRNGDFFGEITHYSKPFQQTIASTVGDTDLHSLCTILDIIEQGAPIPGASQVKVGWAGLIAIDNVSRPAILFYYYAEDDVVSEKGKVFMDLICLLRPYIVSAL